MEREEVHGLADEHLVVGHPWMGVGSIGRCWREVLHASVLGPELGSRRDDQGGESSGRLNRGLHLGFRSLHGEGIDPSGRNPIYEV